MFSFIHQMEPSRRRLLLTCFFAFFCNGLVFLMLGSAMPDLKRSWGLSDSFSGVLLSAHSIGNLIAGFVSGIVPFYLGRRRSIMLLASTAYVGMALMAVTGLPGVLFAAFVLTGIGRGAVSNFNNHTVNVLSDGNPAAANILHACFAVGAIIAPIAFLVLSRIISWQAGLFFVVICGAIAVFLFSRTTVPDDRPDRKQKEARSFKFIREPAFLVFAGMMLFYICSEYAINGWLVTYLQQKQSLFTSMGENGVNAYSQSMATLLWAVILVGRLTCAWLSRRIFQKVLMFIASLGMAAFFAGMLFASVIPVVTLCVAGMGFCMAGICPMIYSDAAYYTNTYPLATGTLLVFGAASGILMPVLVGVLAQNGGFESSMTAILVSIVLLVLFSAINTRMRSNTQTTADSH